MDWQAWGGGLLKERIWSPKTRVLIPEASFLLTLGVTWGHRGSSESPTPLSATQYSKRALPSGAPG